MDSAYTNLPKWVNTVIFILVVIFITSVICSFIYLNGVDKDSTKIADRTYNNKSTEKLMDTESNKSVFVFDGSVDESGKDIMKEYILINTIKVGEQEGKLIILLDKGEDNGYKKEE